MAERWNPLRRTLYFVCGAVLGALAALPLTDIAHASARASALVLLCAALLVGAISATIGDRFWDGIGQAWFWMTGPFNR